MDPGLGGAAVRQALDRYKRCASEGAAWSPLKLCTVPKDLVSCMLPNMSNAMDSPYHLAKKRIAESTGELTSLWSVGIKERQRCMEQGVLSWHDLRFSAAVALGLDEAGGRRPSSSLEQVPPPTGGGAQTGKPASKEEVIQRIASVNRRGREQTSGLFEVCNRALLGGMDTYVQCDKKSSTVEFFVDFETTSDVNDSFDQSTFPRVSDETSCIFMIGVCWVTLQGNVQFECFVADSLSHAAERTVITDWLRCMRRVNVERGFGPETPPFVWHWSSAEPVFLRAALARPSMQEAQLELGGLPPLPEWCDLPPMFKKAGLVVRGQFGYSIKQVAKSLYKEGLIDMTWPEDSVCGDGLSAMICAFVLHNQAQLATDSPKLSDSEFFQDIVRYNEVDVVIMQKILHFVRHIAA